MTEARKQRLRRTSGPALTGAAVVVGVLVIILAQRMSPPTVLESGTDGTPTPPPSPNIAGLFGALESGDATAVAEHVAAQQAYFDAGGDPVAAQSVAGTPDVSTVATAVADSDVDVRRRGMASLAFNRPYEGGEAAADLIEAGLGDSDAQVRTQAARAAHAAAEQFRVVADGGETPVWDWEADSSLRGALVNAVDDMGPDVGTEAALAVGRLYSPAPEIEVALVEAFESSSDTGLRAAVVGVIGQHAYTGSGVTTLLETARADVDPRTRAVAATATALCGVANAENILREWLFTEENTDVRLAIHGALQWLEP